MLAPTPVRRIPFFGPRTAAGIFLLAAVLVGSLVWRQRRAAPVNRSIAAGMEHARRGHAKQAEQAWRAAAAADPANATAWELLGELYFSTGNWGAAADAFLHLQRLRPDTPDINARLAACFLPAGDEKGALRYAEAELRGDPDDVDALALAVQLLGRTGEEKKRLEYLRRLTALKPNELAFLVMRAEALSFRNQYAEAAPVLERILRLDPANTQAYSLRGMAAFNQDPSPRGLARAEADFNRALRHNPLAPFPRFYLGKVYKRMGQPDKAVFQLETAARLMPRKMDTFYELAAACEQAGQKQKAAAARARFAALRRESAEISALVKRCVMYPNHFGYHLRLGLLTLKAGDVRQARHFLRRADTLRPNDPRVRAGLRQLAALTGEGPEAATAAAPAAGTS
jgi:predicted Zn-dependent protease